ncbi:MAG: RecB family exonuclease [Polyangiaceae bacterium]
MTTTFRNPHLSFSRLQRYEQCPLSFKLHYIDKLEAVPGEELTFGKAVHWALEQLVGEHAIDRRTEPLSTPHALDLWQVAWTNAGLTGVGLFGEGADMLRTFCQSEGTVDPRDVLAVEQPFEIPIGRFRVVGAIDRVDRIDDFTIRVRDYKTNRVVFTRDEVADSLQLSLYHMAAQAMFPWARTIELQYDMLRHDLKLRTSRTPEQLEAARRYVVAVGERTEAAAEYPARLNPNCAYCDHKAQCAAYAGALAGKRTHVAFDLADLESVAREREEVARIAKIAYGRKSELEEVLRAHLEQHDKLELGGVRYQLLPITSTEYPLEPTLRLLEEATGLPRMPLLGKLATVDKDALSKLLKEVGKRLPRPRTTMLRAEIEARATKTVSPRFSAKPVRP